MTDIIDQAGDCEALYRRVAIENSKRNTPELPANLKCYNCGASLPPGVRFCDSDFRNDHAARKACEVRRGR